MIDSEDGQDLCPHWRAGVKPRVNDIEEGRGGTQGGCQCEGEGSGVIESEEGRRGTQGGRQEVPKVIDSEEEWDPV